MLDTLEGEGVGICLRIMETWQDRIILPVVYTSNFNRTSILSVPLLDFDFNLFLDEIFHQNQRPDRHKKFVNVCFRKGRPEARVDHRCND